MLFQECRPNGWLAEPNASRTVAQPLPRDQFHCAGLVCDPNHKMARRNFGGALYMFTSKGEPRPQNPGEIFPDANMADWQSNPRRGDSQTKRASRDRPGQREAQTMPPDQFRNALIDFTDAVTALTFYTQALNTIAGTHRSVERNGTASDDECSLDILEKIARQLHRATNSLHDLYACRGPASHEDAARRAENREHRSTKSMRAQRKPRPRGDPTSAT
ncbi:hypothetical protein FRZ44_42800 [Hypericibacter terrae]|jgi:hypothetical protein|uniref:Uncharacterized protein n=1 Tax=Hypericibacter terrae TaxID=2602015 RepID=A0A5J6MN27_9PROT|nr:hypothetical protein [Hypericibacter terrae]QEX18968.1 hypothetical protein FRZ44_42800 [Hypericibacter terrae]